jgi:hypothetical protein
MVFREINCGYSENSTKRINVFFVQNLEVFNGRADGGTLGNHCDSNVQKNPQD